MIPTILVVVNFLQSRSYCVGRHLRCSYRWCNTLELTLRGYWMAKKRCKVKILKQFVKMVNACSTLEFNIECLRLKSSFSFVGGFPLDSFKWYLTLLYGAINAFIVVKPTSTRKYFPTTRGQQSNTDDIYELKFIFPIFYYLEAFKSQSWYLIS